MNIDKMAGLLLLILVYFTSRQFVDIIFICETDTKAELLSLEYVSFPGGCLFFNAMCFVDFSLAIHFVMTVKKCYQFLFF